MLEYARRHSVVYLVCWSVGWQLVGNNNTLSYSFSFLFSFALCLVLDIVFFRRSVGRSVSQSGAFFTSFFPWQLLRCRALVFIRLSV